MPKLALRPVAIAGTAAAVDGTVTRLPLELIADVVFSSGYVLPQLQLQLHHLPRRVQHLTAARHATTRRSRRFSVRPAPGAGDVVELMASTPADAALWVATLKATLVSTAETESRTALLRQLIYDAAATLRDAAEADTVAQLQLQREAAEAALAAIGRDAAAAAAAGDAVVAAEATSAANDAAATGSASLTDAAAADAADAASAAAVATAGTSLEVDGAVPPVVAPPSPPPRPPPASASPEPSPSGASSAEAASAEEAPSVAAAGDATIFSGGDSQRGATPTAVSAPSVEPAQRPLSAVAGTDSTSTARAAAAASPTAASRPASPPPPPPLQPLLASAATVEAHAQLHHHPRQSRAESAEPEASNASSAAAAFGPGILHHATGPLAPAPPTALSELAQRLAARHDQIADLEQTVTGVGMGRKPPTAPKPSFRKGAPNTGAKQGTSATGAAAAALAAAKARPAPKQRPKFVPTVRYTARHMRAGKTLTRVGRGFLARLMVRGWQKVFDDADGDVFWYHAGRGESSWYPPGSHA